MEKSRKIKEFKHDKGTVCLLGHSTNIPLKAAYLLGFRDIRNRFAPHLHL